MTNSRIYLAAAALIAAIGFVALAPTPASAASNARVTVSAQNELETPILVALNEVRRAHGLRALKTSQPLRRAADFHADSMARSGYFAHNSADGTSFDKRIARFYPSAGFRLWTVGENLLWTAETPSAAESIRMWMASPSHRRNILDADWRTIGISAVRAAAAPGDFYGQDVTIVVTDFGARS